MMLTRQPLASPNTCTAANNFIVSSVELPLPVPLAVAVLLIAAALGSIEAARDLHGLIDLARARY